jgi:hypothetical protein
MCRRISENIMAGFVLGLSLLIMLIMYSYTKKIQSHVWLALYALSGIIICRKLWGGVALTEFKHKMLSLLLIFASVYLLYQIGIMLFSEYREAYLRQLKFLFLPISVFFPIFMTETVLRRLRERVVSSSKKNVSTGGGGS